MFVEPRPVKYFLSLLCCLVVGTFSSKAIIATNSQLQLGNPSGAITDPNNHTHYLIQRTVEAMDYSDKLGQPNWASWDLTSTDVGSSGRSSSFFVDTNLPGSFTNHIGNGTFGGGYDRGHMCPSADRTDNVTDNDLVFFMSNIIPQASRNNQGPWADLENYTRTLLTTSECMIVSGPYDFSSGTRTPNSTSTASIAIPNWTWKIVVVAPLGAGTVTNRIAANTRVISIKITNSIDSNYTYGAWTTYITNAHQIEVDTGFKFFTALDTNIAEVLRWRIDGAPAPTISSFTPSSASAGTTVTITGANFTKSSWVIFNNAYTTNFTINSSSSITVTVPPAASSGVVKVIAPGGLATSSSSFTVGSSGSVLITSQPSSTSANAGATANFVVQATGNGTLSYQWNRNSTPLSNGAGISGATTTNLTITGVSQSNGGSYTCVVTNSISTATSSVATLTVIDAPVITTPPSSISINSGTSANFSVVASGTSPTYKWRKNGSALADVGNITGSSTATLTVSSATSSDVASYSVIVSNSAGSATSTDATLTVASVPTITGQPQNTTAAIGAAASFSVTATGAPLTYQWRKNSVAIGDVGDFAGTTTSNLTVSPVSASDAATYSVVVNNSAGATTSTPATLALAGTVSIVTPPSSQAVSAGSDATFTVSATGSGTLNYQWRFNGAPISGATASAFTTNSVTTASAGSYSVVVTNSFSTATSSDALLSVFVGSSTVIAQWNLNDTNIVDSSPTSPTPSAGSGTITLIGGTSGVFVSGTGSSDTNSVNNAWNTSAYPASGGANKSAGAQFTVSSVGYENIRFVWDQKNSSTGSKYVRLQYTTNGSVWIDSTVNAMSGTSFVTVSNNLSAAANVRNNPNLAFRVVSEYQSTTGLGSTNDFVGTTGTYGTGGTIRYDMVTVYGDALIPPTIATPPQSQTKNAGDIVTFTVTPAGSAPFTYKWRRNGSPLTDAGNISGSANLVLTIANAGSADVASYSVIVSNSVGSATSANATLTLNLPPSIGTQPVSRTNVVGTLATFNVSATGSAVQYQWRKNSTALSNGANISGATTFALSIANVATTDAASYSVDVSNALNVVTSTAATLTVVVPAAITADPMSQTVVAGNPASFSATATGTAPLSYQWRRNGTPVAGATTSTISIASAQQSNAGSYDLVATNFGGSATSAAAVLTVLDPPSISTQPISQTTFAGADIIFTISATGTAPFTYEWRQDGENLIDAGNITGSQTASLTVHNVHDADNGAYSVLVQNSAGTATSADGQLTVVPFANRLLNITTNFDGTPALLWSVVSGDSYSFEYKDNLTNAQWTSLGNYTPAGATLAVSDSTLVSGQRYYRLSSLEGVTDIAGFMKFSLLGNSDNFQSMPVVRPSAATLLVQSVGGNVVNVTPSPNWSNNQFVYASGTQSNVYYARFISGAAEGRLYPITANGSASVTLNLGTDDLAAVSPNDSISVEPYWTLGTVFPNGTGINISPTAGNRNTEVLAPDLTTLGINLSATKVYFFNAGIWKQVGQGAANHNDDVIQPNSYLIVRHNVATNTTVTAAGVVIASKVSIPVRAQTTVGQDNSVGLLRAAAVSLNASGLISSGAFLSSPLPGSRTDELLAFDNSVASRNKSASAVYYYWNNAWREVGLGNADVGTNLLVPGTGFIIRKSTNSTTTVWTNAPNW
jgi:uncharacterized protein (TIGR02597 family)